MYDSGNYLLPGTVLWPPVAHTVGNEFIMCSIIKLETADGISFPRYSIAVTSFLLDEYGDRSVLDTLSEGEEAFEEPIPSPFLLQIAPPHVQML